MLKRTHSVDHFHCVTVVGVAFSPGIGYIVKRRALAVTVSLLPGVPIVLS